MQQVEDLLPLAVPRVARQAGNNYQVGGEYFSRGIIVGNVVRSVQKLESAQLLPSIYVSTPPPKIFSLWGNFLKKSHRWATPLGVGTCD